MRNRMVASQGRPVSISPSPQPGWSNPVMREDITLQTNLNLPINPCWSYSTCSHTCVHQVFRTSDSKTSCGCATLNYHCQLQMWSPQSFTSHVVGILWDQHDVSIWEQAMQIKNKCWSRGKTDVKCKVSREPFFLWNMESNGSNFPPEVKYHG